MLTEKEREQLACDLAQFLKELQAINSIEELNPGVHNFWRGAHLSFYDKGTRTQIVELADVIDTNRALNLWENACATEWSKAPVWVHGDFAVGNMLMNDGKLSAIIDFGGVAVGDPACDLVIAWTYFSGKARDIFMTEMNVDQNSWIHAKAWTIWKATFEVCHIVDKNSPEAKLQKRIIDEVLNGLFKQNK